MLLDEKLQIRPTASHRWQCQAAGAIVLLGAALSLVTLQPGQSPVNWSRPLRRRNAKPIRRAPALANSETPYWKGATLQTRLPPMPVVTSERTC